jgi:hypothetical protein
VGEEAVGEDFGRGGVRGECSRRMMVEEVGELEVVTEGYAISATKGCAKVKLNKVIKI